MADVKTKFVTDAELTITLNSLAHDANRLVGRGSTALNVSDAANLWVDVLIYGQFTSNTSTASSDGTVIEIWAYAQINDTPTYPVGFGGTDLAMTFSSNNQKSSALRFLGSVSLDTTAGRVYPVAPISVAAAFGGVLPKRFGVFVSHNAGATAPLAASGNSLRYTAIQMQVV